MGQEGTSTVRVALVGRAPVVVSVEGGQIRKGDRITVSSVPGIGMKAEPFEDSIGIALQGFDATTTDSILVSINIQKGLNFSFSDDQGGVLDFVSGLMGAIGRRVANLGAPVAAVDFSARMIRP